MARLGSMVVKGKLPGGRVVSRACCVVGLGEVCVGV